MVRNIFFLFVFYFGLVFLLIFFTPTLLLTRNLVILGGRIVGYWTGFCLKLIMSTKIEIKGSDNLITNKKYFVVSSHQSIFETFFLQTIFDNSVFILKKELTKIPLFGWYLKKMGCISIDRNRISKDNLNFSEQVKKILQDDRRTLIIFPQGTRKSFDDRSRFKKGFSRIYNDLKISCLPVAINSGKVWPRNGRLKPNQTITISILNLFSNGLEKNELASKVEKSIYDELNNIS